MIEVESVINSRPITNTSDSIVDSEALTRNQFLIGGRSNNLNVISEQVADIILT